MKREERPLLAFDELFDEAADQISGRNLPVLKTGFVYCGMGVPCWLPRVSRFLTSRLKSSVSNFFGDKRIKEITSLERKAILGFLKGRDTFPCLLTGYGKSLIYHLAVRVAAESSVVYNYKDLFSTEPVVDESHCVSYW